MLGQSEKSILVTPQLPSKIFQGITTEFTGEGESAAPLNDAVIAADSVRGSTTASRRTGAPSASSSPASRSRGSGSISAATSGRHRCGEWCSATGTRRRRAAARQDEALVRQAMLDGAVGVSTSLQYPPAPYAKTDELIALATEASRYGGTYATHMRSEGDRSSKRSTRRSRSAARRASGRDLASQIAGKKTGDGCRRSSPRSSRPVEPGWISRPTPTPIRRV